MGEAGLCLLEQVAVVGLQGQQVLGAGLDQLPGDSFLTAHGVEGDQAAGQGQAPQQRRDGRDFVGFVVHLDLAEHQVIGLGERADQVDGGLAIGLVQRAAHGLAVDGDDIRTQAGRQGLHPGGEAVGECVGVQGGKDPAKGVMRWNAVRQVEEVGEEIDLGFTELFDLRPAFRATNHGADGNGQDVFQWVELGAVDAGIFKLGEMLQQWADRRHRNGSQRSQ